MNRTDRLTGILLALQGGRRTAAQLAARFEVSRRTILRDVDALSQIGVPIVALPGVGGGLALPDGYWVRPVNFTAAEATALLLAARMLAEHPDAPLAEASAGAAEKLRAALRSDTLAAAEVDLRNLSMAPPRHVGRLKHFRVLHKAAREGRWVRIDYQSLHRVAWHVIRPSALGADDGFWYCTALSYGAREHRRYRVDRVLSVEPIPTPADAEEVSRAADAARIPYDDPSHPEVVVSLTYEGARLAEDVSHYGEAVRQVAADRWELRFRCPPDELPFCARTFFGIGPQAVVVGPPELRARVRELAMASAALYGDHHDRR
jgi:predicted DNA-binding transcriptional regulator YafY